MAKNNYVTSSWWTRVMCIFAKNEDKTISSCSKKIDKHGYRHNLWKVLASIPMNFQNSQLSACSNQLCWFITVLLELFSYWFQLHTILTFSRLYIISPCLNFLFYYFIATTEWHMQQYPASFEYTTASCYGETLNHADHTRRYVVNILIPRQCSF